MSRKPSRFIGLVVLTACLVASPMASSNRLTKAFDYLSGLVTPKPYIESEEGRRLIQIGKEYGTNWEEGTILSRDAIKRAWQEKIMPRLRKKWRIGSEGPSIQQQSILNGICHREQLREMRPAEMAKEILALGLDRAGAGCINDISFYIKFLDPELTYQGAGCLVLTRTIDDLGGKVEARWPTMHGAGRCLQVIRDKIPSPLSCE